ncbi:PAS domain S-box protein [bacterium]|nr:PAS domain S-box protein [bacterium]
MEKGENEIDYKLIFNNINDAVFIHGLGKKLEKFIDVNKEACRRLGYKKSELLKLSPVDINSPLTNKENKRVIKELKEKGKVVFEVTHITKTRKKINSELSSVILKINGKDIVVTTSRDISERKKTEELYEQLFDNMRHGVAVYDVKENGNKFYFKDFNKSAEKIEGIKKEDLLGKEIRKVFPGAEDMGIIKTFKSVYKTGKSVYSSKDKYKKEDGNFVYRDNFTYKLPEGDIVTIYSDVTELNEKLEELERLNDLMIGRELKMIELKKTIKELEEKK